MSKPGRLFWCLILAACAVGLMLTFAPFRALRPKRVPDPPAAGLTLEEVCGDLLKDGWTVCVPPDLPGPYTRRQPGWIHFGAADAKVEVRLKSASGDTLWSAVPKPGEWYLELKLETTDGRVAVGVLHRTTSE